MRNIAKFSQILEVRDHLGKLAILTLCPSVKIMCISHVPCYMLRPSEARCDHPINISYGQNV
jgi:hypothetical protein